MDHGAANGGPDAEIGSPCNRICTLNDNNVCQGCKRTLDEIGRWTLMTAAERQAVLLQLPLREV